VISYDLSVKISTWGLFKFFGSQSVTLDDIQTVPWRPGALASLTASVFPEASHVQQLDEYVLVTDEMNGFGRYGVWDMPCGHTIDSH